MTFIESFPNETEAEISDGLRQAYLSSYGDEVLCAFKLGQAIVWRSRTFRELIVSAAKIEEQLLCEDRLFHSFQMSQGRATLQVGGYNGFIFHSPPSSGEEAVGRVIEHGYESDVRPLVYGKKT
jgi:hypothetical protein